MGLPGTYRETDGDVRASADDQGLVRVGVGLVRLHGGEACWLRVFEV